MYVIILLQLRGVVFNQPPDFLLSRWQRCDVESASKFVIEKMNLVSPNCRYSGCFKTRGATSYDYDPFYYFCRWYLNLSPHLRIHAASYCGIFIMSCFYALAASYAFSYFIHTPLLHFYKPVWIGNKRSSENNHICLMTKDSYRHIRLPNHTHRCHWHFKRTDLLCKIRSPALLKCHRFKTQFLRSKAYVCLNHVVVLAQHLGKALTLLQVYSTILKIIHSQANCYREIPAATLCYFLSYLYGESLPRTPEILAIVC